jgi:hypothetical protein
VNMNDAANSQTMGLSGRFSSNGELRGCLRVAPNLGDCCGTAFYRKAPKPKPKSYLVRIALCEVRRVLRFCFDSMPGVRKRGTHFCTKSERSHDYDLAIRTAVKLRVRPW